VSAKDRIIVYHGTTSLNRVLNDPETGVYLEVFEFVYDMFLEEMGEAL